MGKKKNLAFEKRALNVRGGGGGGGGGSGVRRDRLSCQGGGVAILVRNDIKFDIIDSCSTTNTYI